MNPNLFTTYEGRSLAWRMSDAGDSIDVVLLTPLPEQDRERATAEACAEWEAMP